MNKKGMTLMEVLVSLVLISIVMIFIVNLLSDIQQYNYQTSIVNLQVFVSLGIETCRFL